MNIEYNEFIGIYKDVYHPEYCSFLIEQFEQLEKFGAGYNRQQSENVPKHLKDDYSMMINPTHQEIQNFYDRHPNHIFFDGLQACYDEYTTKFSILKQQGSIRATSFKLQRTSPGGGYHIWHGEQGESHPSRVLAYSLYLNTIPVEEAGETEFLYQKLRINPVENTMVVWPAAFTHAHRGNPVLGNKYKYIATGWFSFD
jgi:2OG-Fe(II) oxygenase superfamily